MKKITRVLVGLIIVLTITQCHSKEESKIAGVWQLSTAYINGSEIPGASMGNWLWEFNDAGGFLTDIGGMREKGIYTLKDSVLTIRLTNSKAKPNQIYTITRLDTSELDLKSSDTAQVRFRFIKRSASEVSGEKD